VRLPRARPFLLITLLVDSAFIFIFLVAIQSYLPEQRSVSASFPGYALAVYGAAKLAAQLFAGRLIDHVGRRRGLLYGLILILIGQAGLVGAAAVPAAVFPAAAVYGMGAAVLWPAVYSLASGAFDATERARLTSAMMLTTGLALAMGLGLGFALPPGFPYAAAAGLGLAIIVVAFVFAVGSRSEETQGAGQDFPTGTLTTTIKDILQPQRLAYSLIVLLQATAVGALLAIFRSYGRDLLGVSLRGEALILAPAALVAAGAVAVGGVLADRFGRSRLLIVGYLIATPALLVLSGVTTSAVVVLAAAAAGAGLGLALPSIAATSMDLSHTTGQGTLLSWFMALEGLGHAAGPALGGLVNSAGDTQAVLRLVGVLFAVMAATAMALSPAALQGSEPAGVLTESRRLLVDRPAGSARARAIALKLSLPVIVVAAFLGLGYYWAASPSSQVYGAIKTHGPREEKLVALTFDDGPNQPWTTEIAATLKRYDVKATFFVVGANAGAEPGVVRMLTEEGHLVGNHSFRHHKRDALLDVGYGELSQAETSIAKAAGVCPALFRPPNGFHTPWQLHKVASQKMVTIGWDVQPSDWENPPSDQIVKRVLESVSPGSIVLLHDGSDTKQRIDRSATLNALPGIIEGLRDRGYRFVRVDELLSVQAYLSECPQAEAVTP